MCSAPMPYEEQSRPPPCSPSVRAAKVRWGTAVTGSRTARAMAVPVAINFIPFVCVRVFLPRGASGRAKRAGCRALTLHARTLGRRYTGRSRVLGVQPAARADVIIRDSMDHLNFSMPQRPQSSNCGQALPALPFTTSEITIINFASRPPKPLAEHGSACGRRQDAGVPAARGCARGVRVGDHV